MSVFSVMGRIQAELRLRRLISRIDAYGEYYFSVNGECGGVDPRIYINTFQMDDPEKTYVCRLDCKFDEEEEENKGFWAVTLKHTALNQFP